MEPQMNIDDFNTLEILEENNKFCKVAKVQHIINQGIYILRTINYKALNLSRENCIGLVEKRRILQHPYLIKFYPPLLTLNDKSENYHALSEYCTNGTLSEYIKKNCDERSVLSEELICRIIYQVVLLLKTEKITALGTKSLYLDANFNIKALNFDLNNINCERGVLKMYDLGLLFKKLCTPKGYKDMNVNDIPYSEELKKNILTLLNENCDNNMGSILNNSYVLVKSSEWSILKNFKKFEPLAYDELTKSGKDTNSRLQNIRNWEASLKLREERLHHREHNLEIREKKVAIMEKTIREKLIQAELYLKRCREHKSSTSSGSRSRTSSKNAKLDEEVDYNETSIVEETSKKLDHAKLEKPPSLSKKLFEKTVKFKGHSPLKKECNKRKSPKRLLRKEKKENIVDHNTFAMPVEFSRSKVRMSLCSSRSRVKSEKVEPEFRPISWNEDSKKQAFELLRVLNNQNSGAAIGSAISSEDKLELHTFL